MFFINTKQDVLNLFNSAQRGAIDKDKMIQVFQSLIDESVIEENKQIYPDGYGQPGYEGPALEPVIVRSVNTSAKVFRIGMTVDEIEQLINEVK